METNHKFELIQFSRKTEIIVNIQDQEKLTSALDEQGFDFTSEIIDNEFKIKTKYRLGRTAVNFLKGRIVPKVKYKPKTTKKPIYDYNIVVGLGNQGELIYKQLN